VDSIRDADGIIERQEDAIATLQSTEVGHVRSAADPSAIEREVRGRLYQELDLLAFAFEMEAAEAIERGADEEAARTQQTRLGIRLAQRLVGAVPAPEVDRRLERWRAAYLKKFPL
jgi:hypothetical protein